MDHFYTPTLPQGDTRLSAEEARHCSGVLRHRAGDQIALLDGVGGRYVARLVQCDRKNCRFEVLEHLVETDPIAPPLHLAVAPTKNIARFEWLLEKATEIGVTAIHPLLCQHSERRTWRADRLERILVAAMKQSGRSWLPRLGPGVSPHEFVTADPDMGIFIAHCRDSERIRLQDALGKQQVNPAAETVSQQAFGLMIGPEGDFSEEELAQALAAGAIAVDLGRFRLRTETAALYALSVMAGSDYRG